MRHVVRGAAVLGGLLLLAGVVLVPVHGGLPAPSSPESWAGQLVIALGFGFVGVAVAERTRAPASRVGWVLALVGLCQAVSFATTSLLSRPGAFQGRPLVSWLDGWVWAPGVLGALSVLPLLYPTGTALPRFRGWLLLALAVVGLGSASTAYGALPGTDLPPWQGAVLAAATAVCVVAGLVALVLRHRQGTARVRGQVRWLAWALLVLVAAEVAVPLLPEGVARAGLLVAPLLVPAAVGLAVLRYGLYDIDLLLSRTLVYLALSAGLTALYAGVLVLVDQRLSGSSSSRGGFLAVLVVALLANPLRQALQGVARQRLFGPAADRQRALATLTRQVGSSPSVRESPAIVVEAVSSALRSPVQLLVGAPGAERVVASCGGPRSPWTDVAVRHSGRVVGSLRLGQRAAGPLEAREQRLLGDAAVAVGPLLDSLLLAEELRAAHARLEEARGAERARLHRDLHDGLGPTLAGLTLGIDAARNLAARDPAASERTLARLGELAGAATAEVRRVVDGLRPHTLERHGLLGALRESAELDGVAPVVAVTLSGQLPPLAREVEDALLKVVMEAITNVRRHAGATRCEVVLQAEGGCLEVTVDDDGCGLTLAVPGPGVGLPSMRSRVAELGGEFSFGSSPLGGARVHLRIPVAQAVAG